MMNWEQLLSLRKAGDTNKRLRKEQNATRLGFEVDYDGSFFLQLLEVFRIKHR